MEKELPEKNTSMEQFIECMQELKEFTINSLFISLKTKDEKWTRPSVVYYLKKVNTSLSGEFENFPALISKVKVDGKNEFIYKTTEEFNSIPKQNLCAMIEEIRKVDIEEPTMKIISTKQSTKDDSQETKTEISSTCSPETNLVDLVKVLKPGSIVMQDSNGTITIIVK